jgi:hypothetical protein
VLHLAVLCLICKPCDWMSSKLHGRARTMYEFTYDTDRAMGDLILMVLRHSTHGHQQKQLFLIFKFSYSFLFATPCYANRGINTAWLHHCVAGRTRTKNPVTSNETSNEQHEHFQQHTQHGRATFAAPLAGTRWHQPVLSQLLQRNTLQHPLNAKNQATNHAHYSNNLHNSADVPYSQRLISSPWAQ